MILYKNVKIADSVSGSMLVSDDKVILVENKLVSCIFYMNTTTIDSLRQSSKPYLRRLETKRRNYSTWTCDKDVRLVTCVAKSQLSHVMSVIRTYIQRSRIERVLVNVH